MSKIITLTDYYYLKTEIDEFLTGKASASHTHGNITSEGVISNQANKNVVTDLNGKITTEAKPTIPTANSTATNIKMNGTQNAGSLATFAKADHVHPTDTSRAAASHTHDDRYYTETEINTKLSEKSDTSHNHDGTYLKSYTPPTGSTSQAGIVKLNSATDSTSTSEAATPSAVSAKTVTLTKLSTPTSGYIATYEVKQGGTSIGKIDIPKDYLVKSGSVKTVSTANNPVTGYAVGDKYIDFIINTKDSSGTDEHIYINVKDLVDVYTHPNSGVTAGTNYNGNQTPAFGATFNIPKLTFNAQGHITASANSTVKIPNNLGNGTTAGLSTNDYTTTEKSKLAGIATGATKNTVSDSLSDSSTTNALSAAKGKDLQTQINNIVSGDTATDHNHDGQYLKTGTGTVTSTNIADKTIVNGDIADGTIESGKIKDGTIVNGDIANATITGGKLVNGTITATQLASNSVETAKIKDGAVTNAKLSGTKITASSSSIVDLNDATYQKTGFYYCEQDSYAPYIIHCPWSNGTATPYTGNKGFFLFVEDWGTNTYGCKQTLTYYNTNNTFTRTKINTTWTGWKEHNTNNNDYLRLAIRGISGESTQIPANRIIAGKADSKYYIVVSGLVIDIRYPILFTTSAINSGSFTDNTYISHTGVPLTNNVSGKTVTTNKSVYLEGTTYSKGQFTISSNVFVSDDNLTNNNYYIFLGVSYSTTNIRFNPFHRTVYKKTSDGLIPVGQSYNDLTDKPSTFPPSTHTHTKSQITDFPTIPTKTSQLTNDSNYIKTSSTSGYIKNDGTIGTPTNTTYSKGDGLLLSGTTFSADFGTGNKQVARGDHNHDGTYLKSYTPPTGSTSQAGIVQLNSATNSTSTTQAATPSAVKAAYELANSKSIVSVKQTKSSGIEIGSVTVNGTETKLYQQDNNTTYSTATTSANGLMSSTDKTNLDKTVNRYNGNFISGHASPTKPYLRLFNLTAKQASSSSSHIIFEIIGNNNDRLYAKIRIDMRQNDVTVATSNSSYTVTPLEVYGFDLNQLYFGFIDNHTNKQTVLDIYRKVGAYTNFYIRYADDHTRDGTVTMYSPVVNSTESYTDLAEASTALYNASYTATSQGGTYAEVTNTIPYTNVNANKFVKRGGTSSQFLKADGSVDSSSYLTTISASNTYQPKGNYANKDHSHTGNDISLENGVPFLTDNGDYITFLGDKFEYDVNQDIINYNSSEVANKDDLNNYIQKGTGTVTSTNIADKTIVNGDIADGTIESGKIKDGTIVNADISSSAAIATSKISGLDTALSGKAPNSHTNSGTTATYGQATTSVWGHTKLSSATNSTDETMSATPKAVKAAYDLANGKADKTGGVAQVTDANAKNYTNIGSLNSGATQANINSKINTALSGKAPKDHATNAGTYGKGTTLNYGHVRTIQNLTTDDANGLALGAGQGKALKALIDEHHHLFSWETITTSEYDNSGRNFTLYVNKAIGLVLMSGIVTVGTASVQDYHWADVPDGYRPVAQTVITTHAPYYGVIYVKRNGELYFKCNTAFNTSKTFTYSGMWTYADIYITE